MGKITKYISSTEYIQKAFLYLKLHHGICSVLVDKEGMAETLTDEAPEELPHTRFYPVEFEKEVGGIRCSAETPEELDQAEPHIRFCLEGLQQLLLKDYILAQTSEEMLTLSSQHHFLFNIAKKVSGLQRTHDYGEVVLREMSNVLAADYAMIYVRGIQPDKEFIITYQLDRTDCDRLRESPQFQEIPVQTVLVSLEDRTSALIAPIREKEDSIGYVALFRTPEKRFFTSYEKKFLSIIDEIISPTMESLRLYDSLHDLYMNTVKALAAAIDAKDAYTHGHSFRVAKYALSIGRQMGVAEERLTDLEVAAYMHDLGKIGVPESILGKPGRLTTQEYEEVKKHPIITDKILEAIDLPQHIVDAAVQHHERLDGRGYPLGLEGDAISFFARIIAVADVFDALTTTRLYRDAMTVEAALTILFEGIDTEYDGGVVQALVSALLNKRDDAEMARLYPKLKFFDIAQMSCFLNTLVSMINELREPGDDGKSPALQSDTQGCFKFLNRNS